MNSSTFVLYNGGDFSLKNQPGLFEAYIKLMRQLHGSDFSCTTNEFFELVDEKDELIAFLIDRETSNVLATVQITLARTQPRYHLYINNMVVDEDCRMRGYGHELLYLAELSAVFEWRLKGGEKKVIRFELTNSPGKKNALFYRSLGYRPRSDGRWPVRVVAWLLDRFRWPNKDRTVVWVKDV